MKIELRNVKHHQDLSDETNCFRADIWVDGRKAGYAENEGRGGATWIYPETLRDRLQVHAATLPDVTTTIMVEGKPFTYRPDAETVIDTLVSEWIFAKDFQRRITRRIVFVKGGKLMETKELDRASRAAYLEDPERLKARMGAECVLNVMPREEAYGIYKRLGELQ